MNVTIFGASGGTGRILAEKCVAAGDVVTVLVRDPARLALRERCRVIVGDARQAASVQEAIRDADAVFSTLGAKSPFEKSDLLARAVPHMIAAMQANGVRRLIVLGSGGWQPGALRNQGAIRRALLSFGARTLLKYPIASQRAQEAAIVPSDLDWTIVAPTQLTNSAARGLQNIRVDAASLPAGASRISRADVAAVMFRALGENGWVRQRVYVTW
jgi:putative NADH-flavin reductase